MPRASTDTLFGSLTRAKILRFFAVQPEGRWASSPELQDRLRLPLKVVERELNLFWALGILSQRKVGVSAVGQRRRRARRPRKLEVFFLDESLAFRDELKHVALRALPAFSLKMLQEIRVAGKVSLLILTGAIMGQASAPSDILLVGSGLRTERIFRILKRFEHESALDLRYTILTPEEFRERRASHDRFLRDILESPQQRPIDNLLKGKEPPQEKLLETARLALKI